MSVTDASDPAMSSKPVPLSVRLRACLRALDPLRLFPAPRAFVELRCARRLDRLARRMQQMQARIAFMHDHLLGDGAPARPDADGSLRRMLVGLRGELSQMRCDLALWYAQECGGESGERLATALARLNRIAVDTHAAATRLEAELEARSM
jgi:hypothetical protein